MSFVTMTDESIRLAKEENFVAWLNVKDNYFWISDVINDSCKDTYSVVDKNENQKYWDKYKKFIKQDYEGNLNELKKFLQVN